MDLPPAEQISVQLNEVIEQAWSGVDACAEHGGGKAVITRDSHTDVSVAK